MMSYIAQKELRDFFDRALIIQKARQEGGYGESWQLGRPVGVTDNLFWIVTRIQSMEKKLDTLQVRFSTEDDPDEQNYLITQINEIHNKIEDDLLDLVNFSGFRWVMNKDRRVLI